MESFDIFSNKKDLIIFILGILLLLSITGLYYIRELGEWLGKIIQRIYIFFYSLIATLFFSTGQIINASSNVAADAASLTINIGNNAINDVGNLLKGENSKHPEKKEDKSKENMDNLSSTLDAKMDSMKGRIPVGFGRDAGTIVETSGSYLVSPTSMVSGLRSQSLASIVQKGTPVPIHYEPSILEYWNIGGSSYSS